MLQRRDIMLNAIKGWGVEVWVGALLVALAFLQEGCISND